jgi:hypothetical protein
MSNDVKCEILIDDAVAATRTGQAHDCAPIAQAGSVIQEMSDRQRSAVVGQFGNVFSDRIVDAEFSLLLQQDERSSRELLCD